MYASLVDKIIAEDPSFEKTFLQQTFKGKVSEVFDKLKELSLKQEKSFEDNVNLFFNNARMLRSIIDYKIEDPSKEIEEIYLSALDLARDIHLQREGNLGRVSYLIRDLRFGGFSRMFDRELFQDEDWSSLLCTKPEFCDKTASDLTREGAGKILFIPLANGAVLAGLEVFLRYQDKTKDNLSVFHPVRLSANKQRDYYPRISDFEREYLLNQSKDSRIVVFDEDTFTGETLGIARTYFSEFFGGKKVEYIFNVDISQNPINCRVIVNK